MNIPVLQFSKAIFMTSLLGATCLTKADVVFTENFDNQPDWHSGLEINDLGGLNSFNVRGDVIDGADAEQHRENGHTMPDGWDSARQGPIWAESFGDIGFPENIEILSSNSDKARGGTGKSLVVYRQSTSNLNFRWPSDGILVKKLDEPSEQLFVRFWIRFSDNWTPTDMVTTGLTKLFRIGVVDPGGNPFSGFSDGDISSMFLWQYEHNDVFGLRLKVAFTADPQETNSSMHSPKIQDVPRSHLSMGFQGDIRDLDGDGIEENPVTLPSLTTGNPLGTDGAVFHDDVWGGGIWRKMEFYVKMNSAPGVLDGVAMVWMDDQLIFRNITVPYQGDDAPGGIKWNFVAFGGNANFHEYDNSVQRTEWRAYDDIVVRTSLPAGILSGSTAKPNSPSSLTVQ